MNDPDAMIGILTIEIEKCQIKIINSGELHMQHCTTAVNLN